MFFEHHYGSVTHFSTAIITTGTFMAGLGAIGTMVIAITALKGWKSQSDYNLVMNRYDEGVNLP